MVAKKKGGKKSVAKKKPVVKAVPKKATKKKPVKAKVTAKPVKKATKKKTAKKPVVTRQVAAKKQKPAKKARAVKKAPAKPVAKKKAPVKKAAPAKPAVKPVTKKKAVVKKAAAPAKPVAVVAPKKAAKLEKKPAPPVKSGKAQIQEMKNKVFRRSATEVQPFQPYRVEHGEEYMNTPQREHFRTILMDWKKVLMEEVDRTVHHMQDEAANFPDPNDRATQEEEFALELRTRDRERKLIRKIDEAIISLETGDYGYCEVCGVEIGVKRLEARPTATLCIDCKTLDEIKEKQLG
jgi:DnaK suppressor protein